MKKIQNTLKRGFESLEATPLSFGLFALTFFCLIAVRLTIDLTVEGFPALSFFQLFFQWSHLFLFFLFSYLLLLPFVQKAGNASLPEAARVLLFGFLLILLAPIIDKIIFGDSAYWSFYIFDSIAAMPERFLLYFGDNPHLGITYGTRVNVFLILISVFLYGFAKTGNLLRSLLWTIITYAVLFFLGTLPSWLAYIILSPEYPILTIANTHIAEVFLSPETILNREISDLRSALGYKMSLILLLGNFVLGLFFWHRLNKKEFFAFFQNVRWPQILCQNGILLLGMLLALVYSDASFPSTFFSLLALIVLLLATTAAWIASIFVNDIYDQKIDTKSNRHRPLVTGTLSLKKAKLYAVFFFLLSLLGAGLVSFQATLLLAAFQALATLYSAPPFRIKRFFGFATLTASFAGMILLLLGYALLHPTHTLEGLPLSLFLYLGAVYVVMLPLKDFKDVEGDKADGIYTLPVLFGIKKAKLIMSVISFLVFISSLFVLHAPQVLLWSLLFGSLSFWLIQRVGTKKSRFGYQDLMSIFVTLAIIYGFGLILFLL